VRNETEKPNTDMSPQNYVFDNAALKARLPGDLRLMELTSLPNEWEEKVVGFRTGISFARFLRMKLFAPLFPKGSIQAAARCELLGLDCFDGTRNECSAALIAHVPHSNLCPLLGYWNARRALRSIFDIYDAVCKVIERNDALVVSLIERPKRSNAYKAREQERLRARHSSDLKQMRKAKGAVLARLYKRVTSLRWKVNNLEWNAKRKLARAEQARKAIQEFLQRAEAVERELGELCTVQPPAAEPTKS
jgi:hypothetical protein